MRGWRPRFSLPLLMKELVEQSARRRLFMTRVVYASLLFVLAAMFVIPMVYARQLTTISMLGAGREVFAVLLVLQFLGVYLFLPAITCGAITIEKERNTLALLFLTKLAPATIVFEKLASRLVLMLNLMLTSLPLMAFSYSLGGIQVFDLFSGVWFLSLSVIQVASISIMASAFFRTTAGAFLGTYFVTFLLSFGLLIYDQKFLGDFGTVMFFPPGLHGLLISNPVTSIKSAYLVALFSGIPTLLSALICLLLARWCLVRRAFLAPANPLLKFFKLLDWIFVRANKRYTGGVVLIRESQTLPGTQPVAWRETVKRSLGQFRYLVRILVVLEFPVLGLVLLLAADGVRSDNGMVPVSLLFTLAWIAVTLIVTTSAASLITGERGRQTLDVLLTSPLTSRQIILEKLSGVRRLIMVCSIPLITCVLFECWWRYLTTYSNNMDYTDDLTSGRRLQAYIWPEYLAGGLLTTYIYLNLIAWLSLWMGIRTASPARAILASLGTLVAWFFIPLLVGFLMMQFVIESPDDLFESPTSLFGLFLMTSPLSLIGALELDGVYWLYPEPYVAVAINSAFYLACWMLIRHRVLSRADRYLGRMPGASRRAEPEVQFAETPEAVAS